MYRNVYNNGSVYIYTIMQYVAATSLYPSSGWFFYTHLQAGFLYPSSLGFSIDIIYYGFSAKQGTNMSLSCLV